MSDDTLPAETALTGHDMTSIFVWNNGGDGMESESLEMPDDLEAKDIAHHVKRCAMRYKLLRRQGIALDRKMNWLLFSFAIVGLGIIATSGPGAVFFAKLWHG